MSTLTTYTITELLQLEPPTWLIDGILPEQCLAALYGLPGDGKSFIALDIALTVAMGVPWQGHTTRKGYVVYISAEGGRGISKRVGAWLTHHQIKPQDYPCLLANFVVSAIRIHPESEDLGTILRNTVDHPEYRALLAGSLDSDETPPPLFIIVDTLARCFEGDENQQEDMGAFIKGLDDLREAYDATILVVHHTGKHGPEERGSSAFRGACDTMMKTGRTSQGHIALECTKQKDAEDFPLKTFELTVIPSWDSCVIQSVELRMEQERDRIEEYLTGHLEATVREIAESLGIARSTVHRRVQEIKRSWDKT